MIAVERTCPKDIPNHHNVDVYLDNIAQAANSLGSLYNTLLQGIKKYNNDKRNGWKLRKSNS